MVVCNLDMIPPAVQRDAAARMKATTIKLSSSHVPMLSQPRDVARVIEDAAAQLAVSAIISAGQLTSAPIKVASLARRKNQSVANVQISGRCTS